MTVSTRAGFAPSVLTPQQRIDLAADQRLGGGTVLSLAVEQNPHPEAPFITLDRPVIYTDGVPQDELSLSQLDSLAQAWSVWYLNKGVRPRDRVAVYLPDSFDYAVHFYALAQIGAIGMLVNSRASREIAIGLCRQVKPVGLYTERGRLADLGEEIRELPGLRWIEVAEDTPAPPPALLTVADRFRHAPEDPVVLLHSSGTTGKLAKPAIHTHGTIVAGPRFRLVDHQETPGALMLTALPQSHLGCIAYTTYAILGGTPLVPFHDPSTESLLIAVTRYQPTAVMAFGHAYPELVATEVQPGALDSVGIWISLGDAVHETHMKQLLSLRSDHLPPAMFFDRLGTTELGWGHLLKIRTLATERSDRCVGTPVNVGEVAVLRKDGTPAGTNEVGLLGAKGPAISPGYWNDSETSYNNRLAGYWLTGDLVYRDEQGEFFYMDRVVDAIETPSGTGYSVAMEETVLSGVPEVLDCSVVAGRRDGITVPVAIVTTVLETVDPDKLLLQANEALAAAGQLTLGLLEVATTSGEFPLGVTGKSLKRQLRDKYSELTGYPAGSRGELIAVATN